MAAVAEKNRAKGDPPGDPLAPETTCTALASTAPEASAAAEPSPLDEALFSLLEQPDEKDPDEPEGNLWSGPMFR